MTSPASADDPITYSRRARARVALSLAYQEISNGARGGVRTASDGYAHPGDHVEDARRLLDRAERTLELAVITEREKGTSWEDIGEALDITKQAAHERFSGAVERWRAALAEPWVPSGSLLACQLPDGAEDPEHWAAYLDEWVIRHREATDPDSGSDPVSGNLARASLVEQVSMALDELRALQERERAGSATTAQRRNWQQRKAELFERLAEARPEEPAYREAAENARRQLAELHRELPDDSG